MRAIRSSFDYLMTQTTVRVLRHRDFALVELAGWFSGAGMWMHRIAVGLLTWELTSLWIWLGIMAAAEALPIIVCAPIAGTYADRYDRRRLAIIVQFFVMAVTGLLAAVVLLDLINIYLLVLLTVLHGVTSSFWMPVRLAIVPNLVPREDLTAAIALHSMLFNLSRFVGPALSIPIIQFWGFGAAFAFNAASYFIYLLVLFIITLTNQDERAARDVGMITQVKEGIVYSYRHVALKNLFLMIIFTSVFLRAFFEILPGIADTVFQRGVEGVAPFVAAFGAGAMLVAMWIGALDTQTALLRAYLITLAAAIAILFVFALTDIFWFALICMAALGFTLTGMNIAAQVMIQSTVQGHLRGRVMGIWSVIGRAGPAIGAIIIGLLADQMGSQGPIAATAAITAIVAIYVYSQRHEMTAAFDIDTAARNATPQPVPAVGE